MTTNQGNRLSLQELEEKKYYLGCYLNMAQHNAYLILKSLTERYQKFENIADGLQEESLSSASVLAFLKKNKADLIYKKSLIAQSILERFPFLTAMLEETTDRKGQQVIQENHPEEIAKNLGSALNRLKELRYRYSHYYYEKKNNHKYDLNSVFDAAKKGIVRRFHTFIKEPHTTHLNEVNFALTKEDGDFSTKGLVLFICLFLNREHAFRFLGRIEGFESSNDIEQRATLECFTYHCCRLPLPRLESSSIELDMLNELNRCPYEVLRHLSPKDQQLFEATSEELGISSGYENFDESGQKIIMARHGDRFPVFVMRFLDDYKWLERMRFQIHFGKINTAEYEKGMRKITIKRDITANLRGFTRWERRVLAYLPDNWKTSNEDHPTIINLIPEIEQFAPRYHIVKNRIGIKFLAGKRPDHLCKLKLFPDDDSKKIKAKVESTPPDAILSTYELQNLFFYQFLHKIEGIIDQDVERFIQGYIQNFRTFCADVKNGVIIPVELGDRDTLQKKLDVYGIQVKDIPDNLQRYLMGIASAPYKALALEKLDKKIKEELHRLTKGKKGRNEKGGLLKSGEMATYLARDLVFLKPAKPGPESGKPNNEAYRELQSLLAYFGKEKRELKDYFHELGLVGKDEKEFTHPFLHYILSKKNWPGCRGILDFYLIYIQEKIAWLRIVRNEIQMDDFQIERRYGYFLKVQDELDKKELGRALAKMLETNGQLKEKIDESEKIIVFVNNDILLMKLPDEKGEKLKKSARKELKESIREFANKQQDYNRLRRHFILLGLLEDGKIKYPHPFLDEVRESHSKNLKAFFGEYLHQRKRWIKGIIQEISGITAEEVKEKYGYFLFISQTSGKDKDYLRSPKFGTERDEAGNRVLIGYNEAPVFLPRGLFNRAIVVALRKKHPSLGENESLINCLKLFLEEKSQAYYQKERIYEREITQPDLENAKQRVAWWNKNESKDGRRPKNEVAPLSEPFKLTRADLPADNLAEYLKKKIDALEKRQEVLPEDDEIETELKQQYQFRIKDLKRLRRRFIENEQKIRYLKSNDRILWLMIKQVFAHKRSQNENLEIKFEDWKLAKIGFDNKKDNLLDENIRMSLNLYERTIEDELPIKRYGEFRRFMKDRRLWTEPEKNEKVGTGLLQYYPPETTIKREILKDALIKYDWKRELFFKTVLDFEQKLFDQFKKILLKEVENGHVTHYIQLKTLQKDLSKNIFSPYTLDQITELRNKFFHNQVPFGGWLEDILQKNQASINVESTITEKLLDIATKKYESLI